LTEIKKILDSLIDYKVTKVPVMTVGGYEPIAHISDEINILKVFSDLAGTAATE